jgi:uncharacterized protein (DUF362 family)
MKTKLNNRRAFIKESLVTGVGLAAGWEAASLGGIARAEEAYTARVAISKGADRADNAFRALQMFKKEIAAAIGSKRVVIKPNFVVTNNQWAYTRVQHVEGILEFLKSIGKRDVVIAESSAGNHTMDAYDVCGYLGLTNKYPVKLTDLNQEGTANADIWMYGAISNPTQRTIRISKLYLNPNNFIISATPIKTHNTVLVTLATKNIAMSAPVIDPGFGTQPGARREKYWMHGEAGGGPGKWPPGDFQALNDNVYRLVKVYGVRPHLAVLDGYQGTEHNGPHEGTGIPTPQKLAVASLDWLAADRVGLALMGTNVFVPLNQTPDGHPMPYPACLNYLGQAGLGEWDDRKIQVMGDLGPMTCAQLAGNENVYNYVANDNQSSQLGIRTYPRD